MNTATSAQPKTRVNPNLLDADEMTALLHSGEQREILRAYFGPQNYRDLCKLARTRKTSRPLGRVYLLPGFMGTRLVGETSRLLWLDPAAVIGGELLQLALPGRSPVRVLGAMLPSCLKLKLVLEHAGFDVRLHSYDWRLGIARLGKSLARQIEADDADKVMIVAHSMGGLVARAALKHCDHKVSKLVQLGTPNLGSFALVQALRAVYPTVLKLGALDRQHTGEKLTDKVFRTLPGVYDMLPRRELTANMDENIDLFDERAWPNDSLTPDRALLRRARHLPGLLADADRRCHSIVGLGQQTNVGVELHGAEPRYRFSRDGDGTVARSSAAWRGATIWYADVRHGELTKDTVVCAGVVDILKQDATRHLRRRAPTRRATIRSRSESELRAALQGKVQWEQLPAAERRRLLEPQISAAFRSQCRATKPRQK